MYNITWHNVIKDIMDFKRNKGNIYYLDWVQAKQSLLNEIIKIYSGKLRKKGIPTNSSFLLTV